MNRLFTARGDYNNFVVMNGQLRQGEIFLQTETKSNNGQIAVKAYGIGEYTPEKFRAGDIFIGNAFGDSNSQANSYSPTLFRSVGIGSDGDTSPTYKITLPSLSIMSLYGVLKAFQPGDILLVEDVASTSVTQDSERYYPHKGDLVLIVNDPKNLDGLDDESKIGNVIKIIKTGASEYITALKDSGIRGQEFLTSKYSNALEVVKSLSENAIRAGYDSNSNNTTKAKLSLAGTYTKANKTIKGYGQDIPVATFEFREGVPSYQADGTLYHNDTEYAFTLTNNNTFASTWPTALNDPLVLNDNNKDKWILPGDNFLIYDGKIYSLSDSRSQYFKHTIEALSHDRAKADYDAGNFNSTVSTVEEALTFLDKNKADINPTTHKIYSELLPDSILGSLKYSGTINDDTSLKIALEKDDGGLSFIELINGAGTNIIYKIDSSEYSQADLNATRDLNGGDDFALLNSGKYYIYNGDPVHVDSPAEWFNVHKDTDLWIQPGDQFVIDKVKYSNDATTIGDKAFYAPTSVVLSFVEGADAITSIDFSTNAQNQHDSDPKNFTSSKTFFDALAFKDKRRNICEVDHSGITTTPLNPNDNSILETFLNIGDKTVTVEAPNAALAFDMSTSEAYAFTYFDESKVRRINKYLRFGVGQDNILLVGAVSNDDDPQAHKVYLDKSLAGNITSDVCFSQDNSSNISQMDFKFGSGVLEKTEANYLTYLKELLSSADSEWHFASHALFNKGEISLPYAYSGPLATVTLVMDVAQQLRVLFGRSADSFFEVESSYIPVAINAAGGGIEFVNSIFKQTTESSGKVQKITVTNKQTNGFRHGRVEQADVNDQNVDVESSLVFMDTLKEDNTGGITAYGHTAKGNPLKRIAEENGDGVFNVMPNHSGVLLNCNSVIDGGVY